MKNKLYLALMACTCFLISCSNSNESGSDKKTQNLALVKNIRDAIDSSQWNKLDDYIAADAIDHDGDQGYIKGRDSIKMMLQMWHTMADDKVSVIRELADDDYVMTWVDSKGKYLVAGQGHKAGDTFAAEIMDITKVANGKAVEHWMMMMPADAMKMMASTTAPAVQTDKELRPDSLMKKKGMK
jgi:predicted SnoaL-like aldol condensation-catalyzing enzyme